jgi:hypothetical protein
MDEILFEKKREISKLWRTVFEPKHVFYSAEDSYIEKNLFFMKINFKVQSFKVQSLNLLIKVTLSSETISPYSFAFVIFSLSKNTTLTA